MGLVVNATPWSLYSEKETRYPLYRRLGVPQGLSGRVRKYFPPPGFDPRAVHPVAGNCIDYPRIFVQLSSYAFSNDHSVCRHSVALGSAQPLTEVSTKEFPWGQSAAGAQS